jgi:hypothetical protein
MTPEQELMWVQIADYIFYLNHTRRHNSAMRVRWTNVQD